ncbi:MAG: hydrogenase formation protein HypD [Deltaproteobacteria bacterium]|nr:hydrogenase formation protein HypD [Deltaproteobacteria bacterium]
MKLEISEIVEGIKRLTPKRTIKIMEVCGTHTVAIARSGIRELLPKEINLVSGPGCPVCVTPQSYIDKAIWLSKQKDIIITTFGDLMRVPGSERSLALAKMEGSDIRVLYSPVQSLEIAEANPSKLIVLLAVGFETTIPTISGTLEIALRRNIKNIFIFSAHKIVPPALKVLASSKELMIDGFILPGHVSAVIGIKPYEFLAREYNKACVISGFEPLHILEGIFLILAQIHKNNFYIANQYKSTVDYEGNVKAQKSISKFFDLTDSVWRGIGNIPRSGLTLKCEYNFFDIEDKIQFPEIESREPTGCRCGDVLKGLIEPIECPLFGRLCTYENPVGACMVSSEGSCAAYYKYRKRV